VDRWNPTSLSQGRRKKNFQGGGTKKKRPNNSKKVPKMAQSASSRGANEKMTQK